VYQDKAAKAKQEYEDALKKYHNQLTSTDVAIYKTRASLRTKLGRKTAKVPKFPGAPKRPLTPYMLFLKDIRSASTERQKHVLGISLKEMGSTEIVKTVAAKWKTGSADLKKVTLLSKNSQN
jgi:hypothetical protein